MKRVSMFLIPVLALTVSLESSGSGFSREAPEGGPFALSSSPTTRGHLSASERPGLRYRITASKPRLNRRLMGPVRRWVGRVAAEPVDSFCWSGEGSVPIEGTMTIDVEPLRNSGKITAEWTDANGTWTWRQSRFLHPSHHSSGVRIGSSIFRVDTVINEPIAHNVYLHGDTAAGQPVLPTVFAYLATWGPGDATLDGQPFENEFEVPAPQWLGHVMVTEGARGSDGSVRTLSGEIYDPSRGDEGAVETGDIEAHLVFHDDAFPTTTSIPPLYSFFYHLVFEEVRIEILQSD
jgi:hypothetical protein